MVVAAGAAAMYGGVPIGLQMASASNPTSAPDTAIVNQSAPSQNNEGGAAEQSNSVTTPDSNATMKPSVSSKKRKPFFNDQKMETLHLLGLLPESTGPIINPDTGMRWTQSQVALRFGHAPSTIAAFLVGKENWLRRYGEINSEYEKRAGALLPRKRTRIRADTRFLRPSVEQVLGAWMTERAVTDKIPLNIGHLRLM
jgi:hypothetical protein